jgi:hypothetical protein
MNFYVVTLGDFLDRMERKILCRGEEDLANFLRHVDKKRYAIINIETVNSITEDREDFLLNDEKLEKGS